MKKNVLLGYATESQASVSSLIKWTQANNTVPIYRKNYYDDLIRKKWKVTLSSKRIWKQIRNAEYNPDP